MKQAPRVWNRKIGSYMVNNGFNDKRIFICQCKYANDVLKRFRMINYNPTSTLIETSTKLNKEDTTSYIDASIFRKLVGNLMYLTTTRLDIMYGVRYIESWAHPIIHISKMEKEY